MELGLREMVTHQGGVNLVAPTSAVRPAELSQPDLLAARIEFGGFAAPVNPRRYTSRQAESTKRGLRFEAKVTRSLAAAFPLRFAPQLSFSFQTNAKRGRAIPDGILLAEREAALCIIEIKARHTVDAWWQLERFYAPIVREAFPSFRVCLLEICGVYDPSVPLRKPVALIERPEDVFETRECFHPVFVTRKGLV